MSVRRSAPSPRRAPIGWLVALVLLPAPLPAAEPVDVVRCGQTLRRGQVGVLRRDIDCHGAGVFPASPTGVHLHGGATLELNGHTIVGDGRGAGTFCAPTRRRARCRIVGPGTITGFEIGINGAGCHLRVDGVVVEGNGAGILGQLGCSLRATESTVVDSAGDGIWVSRFRGTAVAVARNGGAGVRAGRIGGRGLTVSGNGADGVVQTPQRRRFGRIVASTLVDNGREGGGVDVTAAGRLRLRDVTCERSTRVRRRPRGADGDRPLEVVGSFGCALD